MDPSAHMHILSLLNNISAAVDPAFSCFKFKPFSYSERPRLVFNQRGYTATANSLNNVSAFQSYQFRHNKILRMNNGGLLD